MQNFIEFLTTPWVYIYYTALIVLMLVYFYLKGRSERAKREAMELAKRVVEKKDLFHGKGSHYSWAYVFKESRFVGKIRFRKKSFWGFNDIPKKKVRKLVPESGNANYITQYSYGMYAKNRRSEYIEINVMKIGRNLERQLNKEGVEVIIRNNNIHGSGDTE